MIKCSECGYENTEGLDYCDSCGAALSHEAPAAPPPESAPSQQTAATAPHGVETPSGEAHPAESAAVVKETTPAPAAEAGGAPQPVAEPQPAAAPVLPVGFKAKLKIVRGGRKGQEFPLEEGNNLIGRFDPESGAFPEVDLEADDPEAKISRKHALIKIENGKITIEDIGSLNGTYVNRAPRLQPGQPVELKNGDEVIVGKTFFQVVVEAPS
jgi:hypothetical protein